MEFDEDDLKMDFVTINLGRGKHECYTKDELVQTWRVYSQGDIVYH
jgi:hypothetical protein